MFTVYCFRRQEDKGDETKNGKKCVGRRKRRTDKNRIED
jgi:hypothetical protein